MYANLGIRVVAADLDPQSNLTAAFLDEDRLENLWPDGNHTDTMFGCVQPLIRGIGDIAQPYLDVQPESRKSEDITQPYLDDIDKEEQLTSFSGPIALLVGDLFLSSFEDELSAVWPRCLDKNERAFRVTSAFWRMMQAAATTHKADVILMDLGPNLGAINRAALIAADFVVVVLSPDLFSLQGLRNLGPTLRRWRLEWQDRLHRHTTTDLPLPPGYINPIGYVVLQHAIHMDRPVKAYERWIARIPEEYKHHVLNQINGNTTSIVGDSNNLAPLKHYRSLMPMAQEARKLMFHLKPADGAIGSHTRLVHDVYIDFKRLAREIASRTNIQV